MNNKVNVLGVSFDSISRADLLKVLKERINNYEKTFIVTANPEIVMHAKKSKSYKNTINNANYIIADGIGVIYGSRIIKQPLPERIPGFELMLELLEVANQEKLRVYFLGARQEVIDALLVNIKQQFPNLEIAGAQNGFFDPKDESVAEKVASANADLIFVALGFPRQEEWIQQHINDFNKGLFMGVGGSFDVLANKVKRAPVIWQKMNLEWLYRLIKQPSRWKRMMVLPQFLIEVFATKKS